MTIEGKVVKAFREELDLVGKDGQKRHNIVSRVLVWTDDEVCSCVSYNPDFQLPKVGELHWKSPAIKKYENYKGMTAEVVF